MRIFRFAIVFIVAQSAMGSGPVKLQPMPPLPNLNALNSLLADALSQRIGTILPGLTLTSTVHRPMGGYAPRIHTAKVELSWFQYGSTHRAHAEVDFLDSLSFLVVDMLREPTFPRFLPYGAARVATRDLLFVSACYLAASGPYPGLSLTKPVAQDLEALAAEVRLSGVQRLAVNNQAVVYDQLIQMHRTHYGNHAGSVDPLVEWLRITATAQKMAGLIGYRDPMEGELEGPLIVQLESAGSHPSGLSPHYGFDVAVRPWLRPGEMEDFLQPGEPRMIDAFKDFPEELAWRTSASQGRTLRSPRSTDARGPRRTSARW